MLTKGTVWFSDPSDFNDPFDCDVPFVLPRPIPEGEDRGVSDLWKVLEINAEFEGKRIIKCFGIFSLSEGNSNILMWSHYADHHKGLCIEYGRNDKNKLGDDKVTKPIRYTDLIPQFPLKEIEKFLEARSTAGESNIFQSLVFTKSSNWTYEKEWRVVNREIGNRKKTLNKVKAEAVIFGLKTPLKDKLYLKKEFENQNIFDLKYKKAIQKNGEFGLEIVSEDWE
jgi:hypothetical protein